MWPIMIVVVLAVVLYFLRRETHPRAVPMQSPKRSNDDTPLLPGNSRYEMDIVGESHYQAHLARVCNGTTEDGIDLKTGATLLLEKDNPYDRNAVAVFIAGGKVGHLSREVASEFRAWIARSEWAEHESFRCPARIRGGWDRGGQDTGMFGVCLDVDLRARGSRSEH